MVKWEFFPDALQYFTIHLFDRCAVVIRCLKSPRWVEEQPYLLHIPTRKVAYDEIWRCCRLCTNILGHIPSILVGKFSFKISKWISFKNRTVKRTYLELRAVTATVSHVCSISRNIFPVTLFPQRKRDHKHFS